MENSGTMKTEKKGEHNPLPFLLILVLCFFVFCPACTLVAVCIKMLTFLKPI